MKQAIQIKDDQVKPVSTNLDRLLEIAVTNSVPIENLQKLLDMKERVDAQRARMDYFNALSEFQSICPAIKKTKQGHNCKYAPIETIVQTIVPSLKACGLTYRFEQKAVGAAIEITCIINHVNGHSESMSLMGAPDTTGSKNAIQAMGSTVQYLRRYTLCGALGIVTADEDNDAETANMDGNALADFGIAIQDAITIEELDKVGAQIADSKISAKGKAQLRKDFNSRKKMLKDATG